MQSPREPYKDTKDNNRPNKLPLILGCATACLAMTMLLLTVACLRWGVSGLVAAGGTVAALFIVGGFVSSNLLNSATTWEAMKRHPEAVPSHPAMPVPGPRRPALEEAAPAAGIDFWNSLTEAEQLDVRTVAEKRIFAAGAVLFREGEKADHVVVILDGKTSIWVNEHGRQHIIAERGQGQLVGERAALEVNVRSATVIAISKVHALVLSTEDFASFVGAHPRVLGLLNDQVYNRLTRDLLTHRTSESRREMPTVPEPRDPRERPVWQPAGENCTIVMTDIPAFGDRIRWNEDRALLRAAHFSQVHAALTSGGIRWDEVYWEDRGDGLLLAISPRGLTARVLDALVLWLEPALLRYNRHAGEPGRMRLRVAAHVGPVAHDGIGLTGEAVIHTARMLDATALRDGIAQTGACLGLLTSMFIYEEFIRNGACAIAPENVEPIQIAVKEDDAMAWLRLSQPILPPARPD